MKIFKNSNTYEDYYVNTYDVIDYFIEYYSEKIQIDDNKLMIINVNIYYLKLIFTLVIIFSSRY